MKRAAGLLALCSLAIAVATPANADEFKLGEVYSLSMFGCVGKEIADVVVAETKDDGAGDASWSVGVAYGVCGKTIGPTRFTKVYEPYLQNGAPGWYVKYEVQAQDGRWKEYWGFTWWTPAREEETPKMGGYQCGSIRNCS